jgi:hypothetical protein
MSASVSLSDVQRMLQDCAPGSYIRLTNHYRFVYFKNLVHPTLPKHDPLEIGYVKKMARALGILECAKNFLGIK